MARSSVKVSKTNDPAVYVDLMLRNGWLLFVLCNGSAHAVRDVTITLRRKLSGMGGQVDIASLPIWKGLHYMLASKRIEIPIDRLADILARDTGKPLSLAITYTDHEDKPWQAVIMHDFSAYRGMIELLE